MDPILYLALFQGTIIIAQAWMSATSALLISLFTLLVYGFRPWVWLHNLMLLALAGIGLLLSVQFSLRALIVVSLVLLVYDAIAVWKSRHMVTLVKGMAK